MNIAHRFNGEIINGDAMQVYQGLPIITNKMPVAERKDVPHHLLGEIGLHEQTWTVSDFVSHALAKIQDIRRRGKLPILVGGTHYYTQSLLFHDALAAETEDKPAESETSNEWPILDASTDIILAKLKEVDPVMADRWHPNDHRKIRRSLEIWYQTGRKASEIYEEQKTRRTDTSHESDEPEPASYLRTRTLILWVNAESGELTRRLDTRVDKMIDQGLLDEVKTLDDFALQQADAGQPVDMTRGIWVSIGYKEFSDYQIALRQGTSSPAELSKLLAEAVEKTKIATRQYAKRQVRWIRIKLSHAVDAAGAKECFFMLDGSDLSSWQSSVSSVGLNLVDAFLQEKNLLDPTSLSPLAAEMLQPKRHDMSARADLWSRQHCDVCNMTAVTESDWAQHIKSRRHRMTVKKAKATASGQIHYKSRKAKATIDVEDLRGDRTTTSEEEV